MRYWRTLVLGALSLGMLLVGLRPASGSPPAAAPLHQAPVARAVFENGQAKATAVVTKIGPGVGNLELALGSGIAVSELKNDLAQAQSQSADLGLIGTTLTAEGCSDAALTPDQLPQPVRVDNRGGNASQTKDAAPVAGETLGGGRATVAATTTPSSSATATVATSDGAAITISGGRAMAETAVINGAERQAHASVELNIELAGGVQLSGLTWDAVHRTGKQTHAAATFDIGTAKLLGAPIPLSSLAAAEQAINLALKETGISIQMPRVERFEEPTDLIRITPLLITLRDSNAGKTVLGPVLNATRVQREQMFNDLSGAFCEAAGVLLVGDVGVAIASGTGFVTYAIGGAEAISGEFIVEDPFGGLVAPPVQVTPVAPVAPGTPDSFAPPAPAPPADTTTGGQRPIAEIGPLEELCESVHPFEWPECSEGAMAPLGILGLIATTVVGALDWNHQRRRLLAKATDAPALGGAA